MTARLVSGLLALLMISTTAAQSPPQPAQALVQPLQKGGLVIVMRHASSPREVPDAASANADNSSPERQLDRAGRAAAIAMGDALRTLKIPVATVLSSPTYRARETIRLTGWPAPRLVPELGDGGVSMQASGSPQAQWLQNAVTAFPQESNTVIVTHAPNISAAFPQASGVADGEALVFGPDGKGGANLLGRIRIEAWPTLRM